MELSSGSNDIADGGKATVALGAQILNIDHWEREGGSGDVVMEEVECVAGWEKYTTMPSSSNVIVRSRTALIGDHPTF